MLKEGNTQKVLALLDAVLGMLSTLGAPTLISCGGLLTTLKNLALYIGQRFPELETPDGQSPSRTAPSLTCLRPHAVADAGRV